MAITLSPETARLLAEWMSEGGYATADEAIRAALATRRRRPRGTRAPSLKELKAKLASGADTALRKAEANATRLIGHPPMNRKPARGRMTGGGQHSND